jgi:hypothetical protein
MVLDPGIALVLPAPVEPQRPRQRIFGSAGLLVDHRPAVTAVVFGGSDYPRHARIRSGLANSPTFLRLFAGAAVLDSVRLSRVFFGRGPFRSEVLSVERGSEGATSVALRETTAAAYYQPLAPPDRDAQGDYQLVDDGRFSAAMDFGRRARDEVTLTTTVQVGLSDAGVELTIDVAGAVVDWALEFAFRPGGTMTGARALGGHAWQLDAIAGTQTGTATADFRVGGDTISVSVLEVSDGSGGSMPACHSVPAYEPGEEYRFLGGTDAATGELLYVAGRVPARVRMKINVAGA